MQIPLINAYLFCKYFVRLSVGNATKGFATYGCCHPCYRIIPFSGINGTHQENQFSRRAVIIQFQEICEIVPRKFSLHKLHIEQFYANRI